MRGFIALASRADVYTTSASASNVSVYTNTICFAKYLLGSTQTLELHRADAGCAIASLNSSVAIQDRSTLSITPLSLFIYAKIFYLQRFTVLHHGAHNGGGQTVRCIGGNIQRYRNFAAICPVLRVWYITFRVTTKQLPRQLFQFPREVLSLPHHQQAQEN